MSVRSFECDVDWMCWPTMQCANQNGGATHCRKTIIKIVIAQGQDSVYFILLVCSMQSWHSNGLFGVWL